jgi:hypothetical protein
MERFKAYFFICCENMKTMHNYERRLVRAGELLEKSMISEEDKSLIRSFIDQKAAERAGVPRQEKYLRRKAIIIEAKKKEFKGSDKTICRMLTAIWSP